MRFRKFNCNEYEDIDEKEYFLETGYEDCYGEKICVGDILEGDNRYEYECCLGEYNDTWGVYFKMREQFKEEFEIIVPHLKYFSESYVYISHNKNEDLYDYWADMMEDELKDKPLGFILTRAFIECFKNDYRIYRRDFDIDKVLDKTKGVKKVYKVDGNMFTEYIGVNWDKREDIPVKLKWYETEIMIDGEMETESYIHEVWIKE